MFPLVSVLQNYPHSLFINFYPIPGIRFFTARLDRQLGDRIKPKASFKVFTNFRFKRLEILFTQRENAGVAHFFKWAVSRQLSIKVGNILSLIKNILQLKVTVAATTAGSNLLPAVFLLKGKKRIKS